MWKLFSNVAGILQNITIKVQVKNEYIYIFFLQALSTEFRETHFYIKNQPKTYPMVRHTLQA